MWDTKCDRKKIGVGVKAGGIQTKHTGQGKRQPWVLSLQKWGPKSSVSFSFCRHFLAVLEAGDSGRNEWSSPLIGDIVSFEKYSKQA